MLHFLYKAVTKEGKHVHGVVEAKDEMAAKNVLRDRELLVIGIENENASLKYKLLKRVSKVKHNDVVIFTRQFATMISSGLPILKSLNILRKRAKPAMADVIDNINSSIEAGDSLHVALSNFPEVFSTTYLSLVKAGEVGGLLDQVLDRLAINMEQERDFRNKVKSSMIYPVIVIVAMLVVGIIMVFFVLPQISSLYDEFDAELPLMTEIVLGTADFIRTKWYFFVLIMVGIVGGFIAWVKSKEGEKKFDQITLKIPYIGILQHKIISANVIRTLSLLIKSGVSIVESLEVVTTVASNNVYNEMIANASDNVEKGVSMAVAFSREEVFPEAVIQMMSVGEETGKLDDMLSRIAKQFSKDSLLALKSLAMAIEPAMIIVLGVGVAILMLSIIVPIYNLTSQF
jgi:type IV pilus assembly protein PilC